MFIYFFGKDLIISELHTECYPRIVLFNTSMELSHIVCYFVCNFPHFPKLQDQYLLLLAYLYPQDWNDIKWNLKTHCFLHGSTKRSLKKPSPATLGPNYQVTDLLSRFCFLKIWCPSTCTPQRAIMEVHLLAV